MNTNWITDETPKCEKYNCSDEVLVTVLVNGNKNVRRVVKAVYIPYHHCTTDGMGWNVPEQIPDNWEYDKQLYTYWIPEGWYEVCDYAEEYSYFTITDKVVAWTKLPTIYIGDV